MEGTRPVLARLARIPEALLRARQAVVPRRAAVTALCLQLVLLPACALLSAARPYDGLWLRLALATWLVWLWPLFRWAQATGAWRPRARRARMRARKIAEVATELDHLNASAPDIFRTALHPEDHSATTLDALESLYAAWEPRLRIPETPTVSRGRILAACAAFAMILAALPLFMPATLGAPFGVVYRMALPLHALHAIPAPRLEPLAVRARIARGDTLTVVVLTAHVPPGRPVHARVQAGPHHGSQGDEVRHVLRRNARGDTAWFRYGPVTTDLEVRFTAAGARTRAYPVQVVTPPRLQSLSAVVTPPSYTRLSPETFEDFPPVLAVLPGSRIVWKAEADRSLNSWEVMWSTVPAAHGSGTHLGFSRVLRTAGDLTVRLIDGEGDGGGQAVEGPWRIDLKADAPPDVVLLAPSGDGELARALKVALLFRATDDFGVARVALHYTVRREDVDKEDGTRSGEKDVTAWRDARDGTGGGVWDLAALHPEPGDVVELYLEAEDNNAVSGHQHARSATVRLRLPSVEEARAAVEEKERGAATSLSSALERERRVRQEEGKAERPDRANTLEAPPIAGEGEVRRILSDQPRQHLQEVRAQVEAELRALKSGPERNSDGPSGMETTPPSGNPATAEKNKTRDKTRESALEDLKKATVEMEKRLPPREIASAPIPEQKKRLDALGKDQKELEKKLAATHPSTPPAPQKPAREEQARRENRERLEEDLQRNMKEQKDLQNWLEEKERAASAQQKRMEEAARNNERMRQDVEKALDQVKEAMEKGLENGNLTPDLLEKMDRVRELLEEVLDEGEKERLRREAGDQKPEAEDVQRAVRNLLEKKDGMRQELERAIRMLEALRELRAFKELTGEMRDLEKDQRALATALGKEPPPASGSPAAKAAQATEAALELGERAEEQKMLEKRLDQALQEMDRLAKNPAMRNLNKDNARKAREAMQKTSDKLNEKKPDRKASKEGADLAAKHLQAAAEQMEKMAAQMDQGSGRGEMRALLEETLEFTRWLTTAGGLVLPVPSAWRPEAAPDAAAAARVAKWLAARMLRLAEKEPFDTEVLRREASALSAAADAVSTPGASAPGVALMMHARSAARELLKLLNKPENGGGSEEGDGQGESDLGGGETGESGQEGLSGRMRGISGKQMAANQLTQELLRELLQQRQESGSPGGKDPSGSSGNSGSPGAGGNPRKPGAGQGAGQGGSQGSGGSEGGEGADGSSGSQGADGANGSEGGNSASSGRAGKAANAQQKIAEALESLAESADDAGGASRKLRQLAAEARALENELRGPRLDPETLRKRQEQFRTRLLETTDALEERGQRQERRAEAWTGGVRIPEKTGSLGSDSLAVELKRRRAEARKLPLSPEQKQRVEWYYERLLGP